MRDPTSQTPPPTIPVSPDGGRSLADITTRASMRVRCAQATKTAPAVVVAVIAVTYALHGQVHAGKLYAWAVFISAAMIVRTFLCRAVGKRLESCPSADLVRYEGYLFTSATVNAIAAGSAFYLVARYGDLNVRLIVTLLASLYGIGTLVNASSHYPSFVVVSVINFGLGILFWLGLYANGPAHLEIAIALLAVALLVITSGRENARQFRESLRIRTENVALLESLAAEKKLVEQSLQEAKLASESKSRFLAAASHDLRQPLHALTMFLGTLSFHVTSDDARRLLQRIKDTAVVLEEQFNSLLDLSKFDAGAVKAQLAPFRVDRLIERVTDEYRPEAEAKHLQLEVSVAPLVGNSDPMLVERVLRNLVGNAVKYTTAGAVSVQASALAGEILIEVSDTGPGIPLEEQKRIFDEYVQLANPARQRRHGVGLGLAIVRRIDALLALRLTVCSTVGTGSVFAFVLPLAEREALPVHSDPVAVDAAAFRTNSVIWILDDDLDVVEALQGQLRVWGAKVQAFTSSAELLAGLRAAREPPQWILSDDMLGPDLSGLETAQLLARDFAFVRVCLITGNTEPTRLAQLRDSGFPLIIKPAQPEALIRVIREPLAAA